MSLNPAIDIDHARALGFSEISAAVLDGLSPSDLDSLPFGVVGLLADGTTRAYNATEAKMAGIRQDLIIGSHFFSEIGQCMNNFLVAQRFEDEPELDAELDYVLTLRMRPTPVRLRLLQTPLIAQHYILIRR